MFHLCWGWKTRILGGGGGGGGSPCEFFCNFLFSSEGDNNRHKVGLVVWRNCTSLTFLRYFPCAKSCGLSVAIFGSIFLVWMVSVLDYGWVVSSWYRCNFLGIIFFSFSLLSATSSYADDIAHIKN